MQISFVTAAGSPAGPVPQGGSDGGPEAASDSFASLFQRVAASGDRATSQKRTDLSDGVEEAADALAESVADGAAFAELTDTPAETVALALPVPPEPAPNFHPVLRDPTDGAATIEAGDPAAPDMTVMGQARPPLALPQGFIATEDPRRSGPPAHVMLSATHDMLRDAAPRPAPATQANVTTGVPVQPAAPAIATTPEGSTEQRASGPAPEPATALPVAENVSAPRGAAPQVAIAAGVPPARPERIPTARSLDAEQLKDAVDDTEGPRVKDPRRETSVTATADVSPPEPSRQRVGPAMTPDLAGSAARHPEPAPGLLSETGLPSVHQMREPGSGIFTTTESMPSRPQTPLLAQHVAQQLAVSLRQTSDRMTELSLDPAELGKVRMTVKAQDQTIVMTVLADRPETADLMRRHADILQQEFRALGYTSVTLDVGTGQGQSASSGSDQGHAASSGGTVTGFDDTTADDTAPVATARRADGSLDLRL